MTKITFSFCLPSSKDLETLSGMRTHLIRTWGKRYPILNPQRTYTPISFYPDGELRRLMNVATLVRRGFKISKIAAKGYFKPVMLPRCSLLYSESFVGSVAEWFVARLFAVTQPHLFFFFEGEGNRWDAGSLMGSGAKRLFGAASAGTPVVSAGFQTYPDRFCVENYRFIHDSDVVLPEDDSCVQDKNFMPEIGIPDLARDLGPVLINLAQ